MIFFIVIGGESLKHIHHESKANIDINREIPTDLPFRVFHVRGITLFFSSPP